MRRLLFLLVFFAFGCKEGCYSDNIRACGISCREMGGRMQSFSQDKGCQCESPTGAR